MARVPRDVRLLPPPAHSLQPNQGLARHGRAGGNPASGRRRLSSDPLAPRLVRVPACAKRSTAGRPSGVVHQMGARIGYVLRDLCHPAVAGERIEHLELAGGTREQLLVDSIYWAAHRSEVTCPQTPCGRTLSACVAVGR
jgi:hypothetical protein